MEFARRRLEQAKVQIVVANWLHWDKLSVIGCHLHGKYVCDSQVSNEETVQWKNSLCDQLHLLVRDSNRCVTS